MLTKVINNKVPSHLFNYFKGSWSFERAIRIGEQKELYARISGESVYADAPESLTELLYEESGKMTIQQTEHEVSFFRSFRYAFTHEGMDIFFHDLLTQKFGLYQRYLRGAEHELIAREIHVCSKDLYNGHFILEGPESFVHTTRVEGPAKDYFIMTKYTKKA